jgi:deoxyribodipyrimidine photo-lyase
MQMQSGTTGINATRVYNPIKQAQDHDPKGIFVRRWLPAMRSVPDSWLLEPWKMPNSHLLKSNEAGRISALAIPVVDLALATREAKHKLYYLRKTESVRAGKEAVIDKHTSRKSQRQFASKRSSNLETKQQLGFNF